MPIYTFRVTAVRNAHARVVMCRIYRRACDIDAYVISEKISGSRTPTGGNDT